MVERTLLGPGGATEANQEDALGFRAADLRPTEVRYAARLTADHTITPTSGKAIRVRKIGWVPFDEPNSVLLEFADTGSGAKTIWRASATQQTVLDTGATDQSLEITLYNGQPIDVNVHYEEVTL